MKSPVSPASVTGLKFTFCPKLCTVSPPAPSVRFTDVSPVNAAPEIPKLPDAPKSALNVIEFTVYAFRSEDVFPGFVIAPLNKMSVTAPSGSGSLGGGVAGSVGSELVQFAALSQLLFPAPRVHVYVVPDATVPPANPAVAAARTKLFRRFERFAADMVVLPSP
jgi:hypothetical protein